eukprot:TRINITY_DN26840_c0_g1_i1.p1 TRINITY_DN26840_c0_g1~~TRINITY_DN26840_c0_g1_i1.p1  ORF type:complete len:209 (-),score=17.68 TRINITY_DN26840_c0_g1_i1:238-864(-)
MADAGKPEVESSDKSGEKTLPFDPSVKHPLMHTWTLWFDKEPTGKDKEAKWGANLKQVLDFDSVEDFWRLYNNITPPDKLEDGHSYSLFKKGIRPTWEDPQNSSGGKWQLNLRKDARDKTLEKVWLFSMLGCIGQVVEGESNDICGLQLSIKGRQNQVRLALWTKDANNDEANKRIGAAFKKALELPRNITELSFGSHKDARTVKYTV